MTYEIRVSELSDSRVVVNGPDEQSLAVIRDEVKLHGYEVGPVERTTTGFRFKASSDQPAKVREFLLGLADVHVNT